MKSALWLGCAALGCAAEPASQARGCLAQVAATYDYVRLVRLTDGSVWRAAGEAEFAQIHAASGPIVASDIAASGSSAYSNAIGCGLVEGHVWCFPLAGPLGSASDLGAGPDADPSSQLAREVVTEAGALAGVVQLAGGQNGSGASFCAVTREGDAWCWGYSEKGLLGAGREEHSSRAARLPLDSVVELRVGYASSCARRSDGSVWCWGNGSYGELGTLPQSSDEAERDAPERVSLAKAATRLAASPGTTHCAILRGGGVQCWGRNHYGQAGAADTDATRTPTTVLTAAAGPALDGALDLAPDRGMEAMCATTSRGLYCWGHAYRKRLSAFETSPYAELAYAGEVPAPLSAFGATNGGLVFVDAAGQLHLGVGTAPASVQPRCP